MFGASSPNQIFSEHKMYLKACYMFQIYFLGSVQCEQEAARTAFSGGE